MDQPQVKAKADKDEPAEKSARASRPRNRSSHATRKLFTYRKRGYREGMLSVNDWNALWVVLHGSRKWLLHLFQMWAGAERQRLDQTSHVHGRWREHQRKSPLFKFDFINVGEMDFPTGKEILNSLQLANTMKMAGLFRCPTPFYPPWRHHGSGPMTPIAWDHGKDHLKLLILHYRGQVVDGPIAFHAQNNWMVNPGCAIGSSYY